MLGEYGLMELVIATGTIIASVFTGALVVKVDLAKLRTDINWMRDGHEKLEKRVEKLEDE